ncbi:MAG TPA: tRNA 4-thiouridine(8) synthase ThiI [Candidatus Omnitrophota bacterium]|nr:tRNA 4-thiouridine(8) synthase ThiI [Candidatus Omnitrophota bacterium]
MPYKAIVLLSGGLDSILAARLMKELGFEVDCVHYHIDFAACAGGAAGAEKAAKDIGVPLKIFDITKEYLGILKKPAHGYGANVNPCIDCKIFMLKKAKEYMEKTGGAFLVTGEVLGERPMSQRKDALNLIEKNAGVRGILLRPLSAKLLAPTIPEKEGIVDRDKLLDIRGRSRKPQMSLAEKFGIKEYPNPSGGCLLTDPGFAKRVKDLFKHNAVDVDNLLLLKEGRHYRISDGAKLVVGRDENENMALQKIAIPGDVYLKLKYKQGPVSLLRGKVDDDIIKHAAGIAAYHTKFRHEPSLEVDYWRRGSNIRTTVSVKPASQTEVEKIRIQ